MSDLVPLFDFPSSDFSATAYKKWMQLQIDYTVDSHLSECIGTEPCPEKWNILDMWMSMYGVGKSLTAYLALLTAEAMLAWTSTYKFDS